MLYRFLSNILRKGDPADNSPEIEHIKRESHERTQQVKNQAVNRSRRTASQFEQTSKKVYDVAEKIYLATGQQR